MKKLKMFAGASVLAAMIVCALVLLGCVSVESTKAQLASGDAAQREMARETIIEKASDENSQLQERLQWLQIARDNATLYRVFDRLLHQNRNKDEMKSAIVQKLDVSTKAEAIRFINWAIDEEGAVFRQKARAAMDLLNEDEIFAEIKSERRGHWSNYSENSVAHDLSIRLTETAQSPELLGRLLTEEHILLGISNSDTEKKVWAKIEARLLPKVDTLSVEMVDKLLVGAEEKRFKHHLTNCKLIAKLIAKLPKEKQKGPQAILDRMLADEAEKNPCVVDGVDWQGLFRIYEGKASVDRDYRKKADYLPENLVIPSSLAGYPVVGVDDLGYFKLKSVVIPDSVKIIGGFGGGFMTTESELPCCATSLEKVVIGNGVEVIDRYAFDRCRNLREVTIGAGVTNIGENAFYGCHNLTNVTILGKQRPLSIGRRAFGKCSKLKTFTSGTGYSFYFSDHVSLDGEGDGTFEGCDGLFNDQGLRIMDGAVDEFNKQLTEVVIPDGVTDIGNWAFAGATRLKSVVIPEGVTRIGVNAFSGCKALRTVVIPRSVKTIHRRAFRNCFVLDNVYLRNPDTEIKDNVFWGCKNLLWVKTPKEKFSPITWDNAGTLDD